MSKFKIGDEVRYKRGEPTYTGVVRKFNSDRTTTVFFSSTNILANCQVHKLELVTPAPTEKVKPKTFFIEGEGHLLIAIKEELRKMGYINLGVKSNHLKHIGFNMSINDLKNKSYNSFKEFIDLYTSSCYKDAHDIKFQLPEHFSEALKFAKEQMEIAKEYFKEEEFKANDWIVITDFNRATSNNIHLNTPYQLLYDFNIESGFIIKVDSNGNINNGWKGEFGFNNLKLRKATPEEIEAAQKFMIGEYEVNLNFNRDVINIGGQQYTSTDLQAIKRTMEIGQLDTIILRGISVSKSDLNKIENLLNK